MIELIIVLGIISVLFTAVFLVYNAGVTIFREGENRSGLRLDVSGAAARFTRELRLADGFTSTADHSVTFWIDLNNNQTPEGSELITYNFSGQPGSALAREADGVSRKLLNNVSSFDLVYDNPLAEEVGLVQFDLVVVDEGESLEVRSMVKARNVD